MEIELKRIGHDPRLDESAFYDTWSPARQMMMQTNTTPVLLEVLYSANPGGLLSSYISGVTGGLDTVKKALAGIPWLTADDYLSDASALLTGYVVGPAVLANTLRYHKFALGAHHIYGSSRLGTKDYLPGQYYRTRDYTGPMPVFDTLTLTMREPWYSLEYNDAISSLSLSPYGNTQKGKYFLRRLIGMKQYELTNHLGNVQATVTDYPVAVIKGLQGNTIGFRRPALATAYDYYPFGMLMPGRYVSDTTSKCVTITQTKWTQNWNIKIYAYADWVWPGLTLAGGATATASQIVTTTMPVNGSVSFTFEAAPTLENQAQLNIASLAGKPRISIYETLATGTEVELTSIMPQAAGTFNLTYTPSTSSIKVKILGTGTTTSSINWGNLQIWKPEMVQTDVLVDVCEKDNDRYVYGFNGQLKTNEWAGIGNFMDYGERGLDSRIGRWLAMDPLINKYPDLSPYNFVSNNPISLKDPDGRDIVYFNSLGQEVKRTASNIKFQTFVDVAGQYQEAPMPKIIKGYERPLYQKYDYLIAANTFIFNALPQDQKPANPAGDKLLENGPQKLDPTLVKALIMEESKMGTYKGRAPNDGTKDIMQANVWFSESSNDWGDFKSGLGLKKKEGATPTQSVFAGIRILYMKGLKSEPIKDQKGKIKGYQLSWRNKDGAWWEAVKRYNGGGNPNYLDEVKGAYDNSKSPTPENYVEKMDNTPKVPKK